MGDARLLREMFSNEKPDSFEFVHFLRLSEALNHLAKGGVDIVLLDMGLPDGHGLETVRRTHAVAPGVPIIVLTGLDDELMAAEAMKEGAQDYLIKGHIESRALPRALRHAAERHRMQAETDLIRTNQLQFKDEFLSHVSHELRSPLTAIHQFVTILVDGLAGAVTAEQQEYLAIVLRNVKQLQSMISDLLEVTRVQAGKLAIELQQTSVNDAIRDTLNTMQLVAANKGIALTSEIAFDLPLVCADPTRLRQILIILLDNAVKFTQPNGTVKVKAGLMEHDSTFLILEVSDTGCGIDPKMTERIFERLFQATDPTLAGRKGLGLGLHICKELVTRQGGEVWAMNGAEQGMVFSVTLPVFSLPSLIAPALAKESRLEGPITVVMTELGSTTGWLSDEVRDEHVHEFRELLRRCLRSDLDVLLPRMSPPGAAEMFFIVAATDDLGGELITKRIRKQWDGHEQFAQAGLTLGASQRSLEPKPRKSSASMEDVLARVAGDIQALISEEISSRTAVNG